MKNLFIKFSLILFSGLLMVQCQKERDKYYEVPDWRGVSVYKTLQDEGRFGKYLQLVDRTQYYASLKGNALWTVFAPNDAAVDVWLAEKGYASVDAVPIAEVNKVVAYSMVYNKFAFNQLSDILYSGWDSIQSVKKKTPYYETIRREFNGTDSIWVLDPTHGFSTNGSDNNYKYLPFYLDRYFKNRQVPLTEEDYYLFYDRSIYKFTGRNIQGASVSENKFDIHGSNGIIHEIDRVNEPLPTIEKLLDSPDYSMFNSLLEKRNEETGEPVFYRYLTSLPITNHYKMLFPLKNIDHIYFKIWTGLTVPINSERYISQWEEDPYDKLAEMNGYTIFAPNNEAMQKFLDDMKDRGYYNSLDEIPSNVLSYFVNAQLVVGMVWPTEYNSAKNEYNDFINGMGREGPTFNEHRSIYTDVKPASNGFFFGSNDYIKSRYLETVFTEIFLRPDKYFLMNNAMQRYFSNTLREELVRCPLNGYNEEDYTVLLVTDEQFDELGLEWVWSGSQYSFDHADRPGMNGRGGAYAEENVRRLVSSHVFKRIKTKDIDTRILDFESNGNSINSQYDGYSYAVNDYGDMIRYKNGEVEMLGNILANEKVKPVLVKEFSNGRVFVVDKLLKYPDPVDCSDINNCPEQDLLTYIQEAGRNNPNIVRTGTSSNCYVNYMREILDITNVPSFSLNREQFWTILMPNNAAIDDAIAKGYLPTVAKIRDDKGQRIYESVAKATNFFRYHIIPGKLYVNDGYDKIVDNGSSRVFDYMISTTNLRDVTNSTFLRIEKVDCNLQISTDRSAVQKWANVVRGFNRSNIFGVKAVLHEIDDYLVYERLEN